MTEPSQYFKGRTVQEQMNEVIGYVDARAEEVAAAKADDVLEPAEQAKDDAIAAKEAAEDARDATLAALPAIQQDIADLKAEDVSLDGRLDTVELKVQTAEGNIVTIQGQIVALQTADGQNVKLTGTNAIGNYAVLLTGNQTKSGVLTLSENIVRSNVTAGRNVINVLGTTGNCYLFAIRDSDNKLRGSINHQTVMTGDRATRNLLTLQSADYNTSEQTGAIGGLNVELLPSGRLVISANVTTGDGRTASQTIATLTAV